MKIRDLEQLEVVAEETQVIGGQLKVRSPLTVFPEQDSILKSTTLNITLN